MKTFIKIIAVLIVLGVLAIAGLVYFAFSQVNSIAKQAIERGGTYALQVDTTVQDVDIKLTKGTASLTGLNIANPQGFDTPHFFALDGADASVDLASVQNMSTAPIRMPEIKLSGIDVILDKGNNPSNYNKILENLKRFESEDTGGDTGGSGSGSADAAQGPKVVIDSIVLEEIDIRVANMPGLSLVAGDVAINIPSIELKDVGKDEPMTTPEVINLVVKTVMTAAVEAGGGILPPEILGELGNGLSGLTSLGDMGITAVGDAGQIIGENVDAVVNEALKGVGKIGEEAGKAVEGLGQGASDAVNDTVGKAVEDVGKEIEKGLGNLFGGNKNEEDDEDDSEGP